MKTKTRTSPSAPSTERDHSHEIALLAYHLWEASGSPGGQDLAFWLQAEQQLLGTHQLNGQTPPARSMPKHRAPPAGALKRRPALPARSDARTRAAS